MHTHCLLLDKTDQENFIQVWLESSSMLYYLIISRSLNDRYIIYGTLIYSMIDLKLFLGDIAEQYRLDPNLAHGISHWARVLENGLKLAEVEGGDKTVISLFAIFHDACRYNQTLDPGHGARAARLAKKLLSGHPLVSSNQLRLLTKACRDHTSGRTRANISVQICWDSDRLDLARVGIMPHARRLCTRTAKYPSIINWANDRALTKFSPSYVEQEWALFFK